MKTTVFTPALLLATTSLAIAHPGPAGHTHETGSEDWPFDPVLTAGLILAAAATIFALRKRRLAQALR